MRKKDRVCKRARLDVDEWAAPQNGEGVVVAAKAAAQAEGGGKEALRQQDQLERGSAFDEKSDKDVEVMIQVLRSGGEGARAFMEELGIKCGMTIPLGSRQLLIRAHGPRSSLAKLDKAGQEWLVQTSPESVPMLL